VNWRIGKRVQEQFNAFMSGFSEFVPQELVSVFDERELELLIGGIADIDCDDWKKNTDYRGYTENDEVIQWFWKVCLLKPSRLTITGCAYVGFRTKGSLASVCHWNVAHPRKWFQRLARQRWTSSLYRGKVW